jgi:hypothetical protein
VSERKKKKENDVKEKKKQRINGLRSSAKLQRQIL